MSIEKFDRTKERKILEENIAIPLLLIELLKKKKKSFNMI